MSVLPLPREIATSLDCRSYRSARSAEGLVDLTPSGRFRFFLPFTRFAETGATFYQLLKRHNSVFPDGVTSGAVISPDGKASWQIFTPLIAPRVVRLTPPRLSAHRDDRHFLSSAIADRLRFQQFTFNLHPEESPKCHAVSVGI